MIKIATFMVGLISVSAFDQAPFVMNWKLIDTDGFLLSVETDY